MTKALQRKYVVRPREMETLVFDWGRIKWMNEVRVTGATTCSSGVVVVDPGGGHQRHNHPDSDEALYIIQGEGEQMIEDEDGTQRREAVTAGDVVFVPRGVFHATRNTGWEPMRILVTYAPGGPERLLREMPGCTVVPPGEIPVAENMRVRAEVGEAAAAEAP